MALFTLTSRNFFKAKSAMLTGELSVGELASFWFNAVVRADVAPISIGARTNVQDGAVIHCDHGVPNDIGADCVIGHGAIVHGMKIGDRCLIGMGATLLGRTVLGDDCVVAAGAVVPPGVVVPDGMVVMGVPGKIVRPTRAEERELVRVLVARYVELARKHVSGEIREVE
jgi:carbonic anhydrase/acetyltransferase-like protein (isoleucine patch superfamily)